MAALKNVTSETLRFSWTNFKLNYHRKFRTEKQKSWPQNPPSRPFGNQNLFLVFLMEFPILLIFQQECYFIMDRLGSSRWTIEKISVACAENAQMPVKMARWFWVITFIHSRWETFFRRMKVVVVVWMKVLVLSKLQILIVWLFLA